MILDAVDKKILNMLLNSGRVSYTDISKAVDMKPPSVIERIKKMEHEGVIKGYTAQVNYKRLGYDLNAYVGITTNNPSDNHLLEQNLATIEGIVNAYHVTGEFSLLLRVVTENTDTLAEIIKKLRKVEGVSKTNTIIIFSTMIEKPLNID